MNPLANRATGMSQIQRKLEIAEDNRRATRQPAPKPSPNKVITVITTSAILAGRRLLKAGAPNNPGDAGTPNSAADGTNTIFESNPTMIGTVNDDSRKTIS